jgi:hypothetical protein
MNRFTGRQMLIGLAMTVVALGSSGCSSSSEPPEDLLTVYTAGHYRDDWKLIPCYWRGTTRTDLAGDGTHNAYAYGIFVD